MSLGFSRQEYRSELLCPPPGDFPNPGIELTSLMSPALVGRFFTSTTTQEAPRHNVSKPKQPFQKRLPQPGLLLFFFPPFVLHITAAKYYQLRHVGKLIVGVPILLDAKKKYLCNEPSLDSMIPLFWVAQRKLCGLGLLNLSIWLLARFAPPSFSFLIEIEFTKL